MPYLYQDRRKNPPIWRYQIWDAAGRRKSFTGTTSKRETMEIAQRRQVFENEIRDGVRSRPKPKKEEKDIQTLIGEYLAWGVSQGGHHGRSWCEKTLQKKRLHLNFWTETLRLKRLSDFDGILPRVEEALRGLQKNIKPAKGYVKGSGGRAGKTVSHYANALKSFINWLYRREFIEVDPLRALGKFDTTPKTTRRALTPEEIAKLLEATNGTRYGQCRRLGYELALASGLRANELRSLRVRHLDVTRGGVVLDPKWTKNHKADQVFQPLPRFMVERLQAESAGKKPDDPLVFVSREASEALKADLERAGLSRWGVGGKVDFHALRVAYVTHMIEAGADIKTAQTLARHCSPQLTIGIYAKARPERLRATVEAVGAILPDSSKASSAEDKRQLA